MSSDQKIDKPRTVKIGWCHQSANAFCVQPSNAILVVDPVTSPKWILLQNIQLPIGIAAQTKSAAKAPRTRRGFLGTADNSFATIASKAIRTTGRLTSLVR